RTLADVFSNLSAVTAGIERRNDATPVWSNPVTDIERNATRCFLDRLAATDRRRRIPRELLCREAFQSGMRENARQRGGKTKTVRQHVLSASLAKLTLKKAIAVEYLAKDRLRRRRVDVALFHRRACREPTTGGDVLLQARVIGGPVFAHHVITIGAAEVEDIVRILVDQR